MGFAYESDFEDALCKMLTESKGWVDGVIMYPTEADLIDNWARIVFENNNTAERLNGCPLTPGEVEQMVAQVRAADTPTKANEFLIGETICIVRDNPDDTSHLGATVALKIFDKMSVGGGKSTYQIARQPRLEPAEPVQRPGRGDVMLLINGLPVIHIELKRTGGYVADAKGQIRNYLAKNVFRGLFGLVQMFVAMTPEEAVYFANPGYAYVAEHRELPEKFMFHYADEANRRLDDWAQVASRLLSIPSAHKMVALYTIVKREKDQLIIMRPYQMHAVDAIAARIGEKDWDDFDQRGGYVWHTTGSGKTLTSYKAATHVANLSLADKVVLVVDRVDLNKQTVEEYEDFSNGLVDVGQASSGAGLLRLLADPGNGANLIVTTVNKLDGAEARARDTDRARLDGQRIVVVVDECHRSTTGDMMRASKELLPHGLFFGFTGTPIGEFNIKNGLTTMDVFGGCIAKYTIANGIHDESVLEFDVVGVSIFEEEELRGAIALDRARAATEEEAMADPAKRRIYEKFMHDLPMAFELDDETGRAVASGIEDYIPRAQYDTDAYRESVVADIKKSWTGTSANGRFHAMFATSSIQEAIAYKRLIAREMPDLRCTCVFDPSEDYGAHGVLKGEALAEMVAEYDKLYNMRFTVETYAAFKEDVMDRLAHKRSYKNIDARPDLQIDLVIVVDQLLTGYDSAWVRTLYLDKYLEHERIIQAFSRTNRLLDSTKPFGIIRYYRKPHSMRRNIEYAIRKYSGGEQVDVIVSPVTEHVRGVNAALAEIRRIFENEGVGDMSELPERHEARAAFVGAMNELTRNLTAAAAQGFKLEAGLAAFVDPETGEVDEVTCDLDTDTLEILLKRYEEVPRRDGENERSESIPYDIDTHVMTLAKEKIDADYMERKFHDYLLAIGRGAPSEEQQAALDDLHSEFPKLSADDQKLADRLIHEIQVGALEVREGWRFSDYLNEQRNRVEEACLAEITALLGEDIEAARELRRASPTEENVDEFGRYARLRETVDKAGARERMAAAAGRPVKGKDVMRVADRLLKRYAVHGAYDVAAALAELLG